MPQYLLRDASRVTLPADPECFDVFSYRTSTGSRVFAVLSAKAERAVLRSVDVEHLVHLKRTPNRPKTVAA